MAPCKTVICVTASPDPSNRYGSDRLGVGEILSTTPCFKKSSASLAVGHNVGSDLTIMG